MRKRYLCTLQFSSTEENYDENLHTLYELIEQTPDNSIVLAPEVCLTGFDYRNFEAASAFSKQAITKLLPLSKERIIVLTIIEKRENGKFFNVAKVLHNENLVHQQCKNRLFKLGDEDKYFSEGKEDRPTIFEIDNIKLGILICFELRFKQFWQDLEGADLILVPARWGRNRSENFNVLIQALSVINQCYVMGSDASNEDCSCMSQISSPFGKTFHNGNNSCLIVEYDKQEIRKMRRYLDVGIQ